MSDPQGSGGEEPGTGSCAARQGRLERLRGGLDEAGCDALVVTNLTNVRYLTGFTGSAALLVVWGDGAVLLTDGRYTTQAADQVDQGAVEVLIGGGAEQRAALTGAVAGCSRVGLEADDVSWSRQRSFGASLEGVELVATTGVVERWRAVKDPGELRCIEAAAGVADAALATVRHLLSSGVTEEGFAAALDLEMRHLGASASAFETIVASGANAAMPHHRPSPRRVREGELVVVDFGAVVGGYRSDVTRTLSVGGPPTGLGRRVLEVVSASQRAGVAAVRAGVAAAEVDRACRQVIEEAGWGEHFVHGTGHGVGLDIHEAPGVGAGSTDTLVENMVVTVEPGVYLPGQVGARIEDTVVVTAGSSRPLTRAPKDSIA